MTVASKVTVIFDPQFLRELTGPRLDQNRPIGENDGGDTAIAIVDPFDKLHRFGILVNVHVFVGDAVLVKKSFGAFAVSAPVRAGDNDRVAHDSSASKDKLGKGILTQKSRAR